MVKVPQIHPKQVEKVLLQLGFSPRTGKGSHRVFKHADGRRTVIPMHNRPLRRGTLHAILNQIHLSPEDFLKLL